MEGSLPDGWAEILTTIGDPEAFIRANTDIAAPPHVPEISLRLATEAHALWLKTEEELETLGLPPPFWAFAWAGGQGLSRYVLDNPSLVAGRHVLDFATGSGLVAIAAALAGAASVRASDIDPFARHAVAINATLNGVDITYQGADLVGSSPGCDVLLAGDVFYDRQFADRLVDWFSVLAADGTDVVVGDPGRSYLPKDRLQRLETYRVPVTRALEDAEVKETTVWRFLPA